MKPTPSETITTQSKTDTAIGMPRGERGSEITSSGAGRVPHPTPQHAKSLSPQDLALHRAQIASSVKVVLSAYFQPHEAEEIRAAQLAWWCDELQDWTLEQVVWALRRWNRDNPDKRPTPGHILRIMMEMRGKREAEKMKATKPPETPRDPPCTPERAAEILAQAGFRPRRMDDASPE